MFDRLAEQARSAMARAKRVERRELRDLRRWAETTDHLVHLSVLLFVPLLIWFVTTLSNAVGSLSFLLFPPLASGTYTLFIDPTGKYSSPGRFVAGLTIGAACGLGALWVSNTMLSEPSGLLQVSAAAAALSVLVTGVVTWPLDIEEPSAYSTALLALLLEPEQQVPFLGSVFLASTIVAVVFVVWRNQFYEHRATYLYESTQGDDHVLVPMRGETAGRSAMLAARLAAAHDAGKVVLLELVADEAVAADRRAVLASEDPRRQLTVDGRASETDIGDEAVSGEVESLERHAERIRNRVGVPCEIVVAVDEGAPAATTLQTATGANCDLIVAPYESRHGALSPYVQRLFKGDTDVLVHRSRSDRESWKRVLVPVRGASGVAHDMVDFATRLAGRTGKVAVATCIGDRGNRRRAEETLAKLVEPFDGPIETRVSRSDIRSFLAETGPQYDLVIIGASRDRSAASRFISPPTFERLEDVETDVAIVDRNR